MRLTVQRVSEASCTVEGELISSIGQGYMVLVGFSVDDNEEIAKKMAQKLSKLRVFSDEQGKMNLDIHAVNGEILSISQFTLYGDARKGNRPSFVRALGGPEAIKLYDYFNQCLREEGLQVKTGIFGADMKIALVNDGPVTIWLEGE
ncbi:MAG: D-tyrosyl-tRNA(Tyr) deacylase [Erysipelotrichaceae bacterium]|nr:D-tyrosyl-tRNA(Tyr) deacylase [Erysipelotrichaceae bacterium]MCR5299686.1 D-tyrosyl-tRNA(Tyr) deacylase [Erysipelotrichaceae bacterium]